MHTENCHHATCGIGLSAQKQIELTITRLTDNGRCITANILDVCDAVSMYDTGQSIINL
jgi:hypothetical protein